MEAARGQGEKLSVFISYSRNDLAFVDQLNAALKLYGIETVLDRHGIAAGEDWKRRLGLLIRGADTITFIVSPSSAASEMCAWELAEAVRLGKRIIPLVCQPLHGTSIHSQLAELDFIFFFDEPKSPGAGFGSGLTRLITALNTDVEWLREHTRLLQRASEWESGGRPANRVLSGDDIASAKAWVARRPKNAPEPTTLHFDFIKASEFAEIARADEARQQLATIAAAQEERAKALAAAESAQKERDAAARRVVHRTALGMVAALALAVVASGFWWLATSNEKEARAQAERAGKAYELAVDSADRFLTDLAAKFKDTAAIPTGEIKTFLQQGEGFLAEMSGRIGRSDKLDQVAGKLLVTFAELSADGDVEAAEGRLRRAQERLKAVAGKPRDILLHTARMNTIAARIAFRRKDYDTQRVLAEEAVNIVAKLEPLQAAPDADLKSASTEALIELSRALWKKKAFADAEATATRCLELLADQQGEKSDWLRAQCLHMKALVIGHEGLGRDSDAQHAIKSEIEILSQLIARQPQNITYRQKKADALNNAASIFYSKQKWQEFSDALEPAALEADRALTIAPWSLPAKVGLSHILHWQAKGRRQAAKQIDALPIARRALDLRRELAHTDPANPGWQEDYEDALYEVTQLFIEIDKDLLTDEQVRANYEIAGEYLQRLTKKHGASPAELDSFFTVLEAKHRLAEAARRADRPADAFQLYQDVTSLTDAAIHRGEADPRYRYWSHWSRSAFGNCKAFYESKLTLEERLQGCLAVVKWVEDYLQRETRDWLIKGALANSSQYIAQLYAERGNQKSAVTYMEQAATLNSKEAIVILERWYRTGEGPVAVDAEKARDLARLLSSRNWGMKRFTVRVHWWNQTERAPAHFYITDPLSDGHDPVEDEVYRLEQIQGLKIPDDVKTSFRKLLQIARDNRVSFQDLTAYALREASTERNNVLLSVLLKGGDSDPKLYTEALERVRQEMSRTEGPANVASAFREMVERGIKERALLVKYLADFEKSDESVLAIAALDALLGKSNTDILEKTDLLIRRGLRHTKLRQYQKAEDDLLLAIAVRPNDPVLLNLLAYSWLQEEHNLEAAVGFLERAIQTKPNDSDIGDSLGWGYVKTGQIDKGVALLRQVIAARPELADAHAHLADGLRRLGRKAEALTALQSAEKYSQDNRLLVFIADQRRLMTD